MTAGAACSRRTSTARHCDFLGQRVVAAEGDRKVVAAAEAGRTRGGPRGHGATRIGLLGATARASLRRDEDDSGAVKGRAAVMTIEQLQDELRGLTPGEKVRVLQLLTAELTQTWPGVDKTPGVSGGAACVSRTRIPVWTLEGYRRLGWSEARILDNFPTLRAADLANAWNYVAAQPDEIEQELRENEAA